MIPFLRSIVLLASLLTAWSVWAQQPTAHFSASSTSGCVPFSVQFTNASSNATSYSWDFGNSTTSTAANPVIVYTTPGNYTITLTATSASGNSSTHVLPTSIVVAGNPTANMSVAVTQVCAGTSIQFNNTSTGAINYLWDFGDGNTSVAENPQHTYTSAGTYSVTLISTNATGCSDSHTVPALIEVLAAPSDSLLVSNSITCDSTEQFTFTALDPMATNWYWDLGDGTTATTQSVQHSYGQSGIFNISLSQQNSAQCTTTTVLPGAITIFGNQSAQLVADSTSGCAPHTVNFSAGTATSSIVSIDYGDGQSGSSLQHTYQSAGQFTVTAILNHNGGCADTLTYVHMVTVQPKPLINFSTNTPAGCPPLNVSFNNSSSAATSYQWSFGDGSTSTAQHPTHTYLQSGSYTVSLVITAANGCTNQYNNTGMITVTQPHANVTVSDSVGCVPHTAHFNAQGGPFTSWSWTFSDGTTSQLASPSKTFVQPGTYSAQLVATTSNGCTDTVHMPGVATALDTAIPFATSAPLTVCQSVNLTFDGTLFGHSQFDWDFGDGQVDNQAQTSHLFGQPGTYTVSLSTINQSGCPTTIGNFATVVVQNFQATFTDSVFWCPAQTTQFTNTSNGGNVFSWDFGDGTTSTAQHPQHTYAQPGIYNVSLHISDSVSGCSSQTNNAMAVAIPDCNAVPSNQPPPNGLPAPSPPAGPGTGSGSSILLMSPMSGCTPMTVTLTNPYDSVASAEWHLGDGSIFNGINAVHSYTSGGIFSPFVVTTFINGYIDTLTFPSLITVSPATNDFSFNNYLLCPSNTASFQPVNTNAGSYMWNFGDGNTSAAVAPTHTYNAPGNYLVNLSTTAANGCPNTVAHCVAAGLPQQFFFYDAALCLSDSLQINHNLHGFAGYSWDFGDGTIVNDPTPSHMYATPGTYAVHLTLEDINGCTQSIALPDSVRVFEPVAAFGFNSITEGCDALTVGLQNQSTDADTWFWDFGNGAVNTNPNPAIQYTTPGVYSITLTASKGNCSSSITLADTIHVYGVEAAFSTVVSSSCLPAQMQFTNLSQDATNWSWSFGDGSTSSQQHPNHTYLVTPTDSVVLIASNAFGCTDTTSQPLPALTSAFFTVSDSSLCTNDTAVFAASDTSATSYVWSFGDGSSSTGATPTHIYSTPGMFDVTLTVTSSTGCTDTFHQQALVLVTEVSAAFASIDSSMGCIPLLVQFQSLDTTATDWHWDFGTGTQSTLAAPAHVYTTPGAYDVSLQVNNVYGCTATSTTLAFVTALGPTVVAATSDTTACVPATLSFSDQSANAVAWEYYFGDGFSSAAQNTTHTYTTPGVYEATLLATDSSGCEAYATIGPIVVHPKPQAAFSTSTNSHCIPIAVQFNNSSTGLDQPTYSWNTGIGLDTASNPAATYTQAGTYYPSLTVTNQTGCADTIIAATPLEIMDTLPLLQPRMLHASIKNNAAVELCWEKALDNAFNQYEVYRKLHGDSTWSLIQTIGNPMQNNLIDLGANPQAGAHSYKVRTTSQCTASDPVANLTPYCTIHTQAVGDSTGRTVQWSRYVNTPMAGYAVHRTDANGQQSLVALVDSTTTTFHDSDVLCPGTYTYEVSAIDLWSIGIEAGSNSAQATALGLPYLNQTAAVVRSTVVDNAAVLTEWHPAGSGEEWITGYGIVRSEGNGQAVLIAQVPAGVHVYVDEQVELPAKEYQYSIEVQNQCNLQTPPETFGHNIVLTGTSNGLEHQLEWTPYTGWSTGVETYRIERFENGKWELIEVVDGNSLQLTIDATK